MKNSPQYTHQRMGLDMNIWLVMLITGVLCLGLLGYKQAFEKKCTSFDIGIKNISGGSSKTIYTGENLSLSTTSEPGNTVYWNFGDNSETKEGAVVLHSYNKEGDYSVTAKVNGKCEQITIVTVRKFVPSVNRTSDTDFAAAISIIGKDDPEVGEAVTFNSSTPASDYEWTILDRRDYETKKGEVASYTFRTPGRYVLKLKLDNNSSKVTTKYIMVLPPSSTALLPTKRLIPPPPRMVQEKQEDKPVEKPVEKTVEKSAEEKPAEVVVKPKKVFFIPNERFMDFLKEVVEGSKDLNFFNQYLNNGGETLVNVKGEDKLIRFSELYQRIHSNKKISIKELTIDRDSNNDVLKINISYKKRFF